jgi:hypothetical protein
MSAVKSVIDFPNLVLRFPMLSPDGRYVSMFAVSGDQEGRTVVIRRLDDGVVTWLPGTDRALPVTWSPDSRSLAFLRDGELKAADVATGVVRTISRVPADVLPDVTWNDEGVILLGGSRLRRLSAADGHLTDVYRPGAGIIRQFMPSFLPDGRAFLFAQDSSNAQHRGVFLGSLDSPTVTRLLPEPANVAISPRGYFLYGHQGAVFAQRFDIDHKRLMGNPVNLGSGAGYEGPFTSFAVAGDLIVWANVQTPSANLTWVDRNGRILGSTPEAGQYIGIALAPDEQRVVATEFHEQIGILCL